jgi:hypothetical protein
MTSRVKIPWENFKTFKVRRDVITKIFTISENLKEGYVLNADLLRDYFSPVFDADPDILCVIGFEGKFTNI